VPHFELLFIYRPKPQPIRREMIEAPDVEAARVEAKRRLDELALRIAPPPDAAMVLDADTQEFFGSVER
jgi:hypothetical protein